MLRSAEFLLRYGNRFQNILCSLRTLTSGNSLRSASFATTSVSRDDYFTAIHHISNIVRREVHPERTLNRMNLSVNSELVFRVLRSCSNSPTESIRFFSWARSHYIPTSVEYEELVKIDPLQVAWGDGGDTSRISPISTSIVRILQSY